MPQENKKRGRRMKRKHAEDGDAAAQESSKRRKSTEDEDHEQDYVPLETQDQSLDGAYPPTEKPFFGMLDAEEQEYFKRADETLELNAFADAEERELFLSNVYREARGKELKIAQSQSCSRLMERLIKVSTAPQLKQLFQAFSGNFIHLISHRFASHCCEALFLRAAPAVTQELVAPASNGTNGGKVDTDPDEIYVSMENMFLHTLAELEGSVGYIIVEQYASHVLRILLLVLSGEPLDQATNDRLMASKKKEGIHGSINGEGQTLPKARTVPKSFSEALEKMLSESVAGLDTDKLRALATHPNANPTLQLLLRLELTQFGKQRAKNETSITRTLLPDDPITAESDSAKFISGLVYDPIGSHLVEQIVQHAPGKMFKSLNKEFFKERLASLARNEIAGYVACRVLERMSKDDLYEAHEALIPTIPGLLERNRTLVIRTLIERCAIRDVDTQAIAAQIDAAVRNANGFDVVAFLKVEQPNVAKDDTPQDSVQSSGTDEAATFTRPSDSTKVHFNLLAQAMSVVPGPLCSLILDALINVDPMTLQVMVKDPIVTRTMQTVLTGKNASIIQKRKLIQHFYGHIGEMAVDKAASHVVDCVWEGTHGLAFIRERIAEELAEDEAALRDSQYGRAVWKNWKMDLYKRKRQEWIRQSRIKASNDGFQSFSEIDQKKKEGGPAKTPLEMARERHAKRKDKQTHGGSTDGGSTGTRPSRDAATTTAAAVS